MLISAASLWLEFFHQRDRMLLGSLIGFLWGVSVLTLALVSYILQDYGWRYIQLALSLFSLLSFLEIL